jgi:hypothetical protein
VLRSRKPAALVVALALALPPAALADSAGDNQYQDPFSNAPSQPKQNKTPSSGTQGSGTTQTPAPAPPESAAPTQTSAATAAAATPSGSDTLPRTGFPLVPVAAIGAALVGVGLALRLLLT